MKVIADTGFLVALLQIHDWHHEWAAGLAADIRWPALTCESVLSETAFHVRSAALPLEMLDSGMLRLGFVASAEITSLRDLAKRYEDRRPDFADLCLIRMSELYPRHSLLTVDEADFKVYRRNKREVIPLLCPPRKR